MPRIQTLYREYKQKGLEVVALTAGSSTDGAERYFRKSGFTFKAARINAGFFRRNRFSIDGKPLYSMMTFVIDTTGRVAFRGYQTDYDDLREALSNLGLESH